MAEQHNVENWTGHRRSDGAHIVPGEQGNWQVIASGKPMLTICPCCDKPFATPRAAKLACNVIYPLEPAPE